MSAFCNSTQLFFKQFFDVSNTKKVLELSKITLDVLVIDNSTESKSRYK